MKERWYDREAKRFGRNPLDIIRGYRKAFVVSLVGSRCSFCGYDKYMGNLVFHHLESSGKASSLAIKHFQQKLEVLLPEIQKCIVCCHNCHGEIHAGLLLGVDEKYQIFLEAIKVLRVRRVRVTADVGSTRGALPEVFGVQVSPVRVDLTAGN